MDGTGGHYIKWNKLDTEIQVPHVVSHMQKLIKNKVNLNVEM